MFRCGLFTSLVLTLAMAGCTTKPPAGDSSLKSAFVTAQPAPKKLKADDPVEMEPAAWMHAENPHHLAGRILSVSSLGEMKLQEKEVLLTFDDGPAPGKTDRILATLDKFGVKGTFMMVGEMAELHPETARKVAEEGNTIGSHTYDHPDLDKLSFDMAMKEITRGENAVTKATGVDVSFFRFPYLADSRKLRAAVALRELVVMDVDIDSKDYFKTTPIAVVQRTMDLLHKRGRGIILMHDIHQRTAAMLPTLLTRLENEGYKVVTLRYKPVHEPLQVAWAD